MALTSPYSDNASSPIGTQDVGIKISQPGFNAQEADATQLIFDSSWPSVPTAFTKLAAYSDGNDYVIPHNLGFAPFTKVWMLDSNYHVIENGFIIGDYYGVDDTNVYLYSLPFTTNGAYYYINCYNIDLGFDIDYPTLPTIAVSNAYDSSFGIKITKENKDANSTDPRDFVLHSRYRSPLIQAVKTEITMNADNASATGGAIQYTNQSGLPTWNYGFIKSVDGIYKYAPYYSQAYPRTFTDGIVTFLQYITPDIGATLVILRDPLFATTTVEAQY